MKTINFRGITESLNDGEMKMLKGGLDEKKEQPEDETPEEGACKGASLAGVICKMPNSFGTYNWGICAKNKDTGKLQCYTC